MGDPFASDGSWLRCALHAHTTNSDGELPPGKLVRHYERAGFDVLAVTDHWVRTAEPSTDSLLVIPSTEIDTDIGRPGREAHILGFGVSEDPVRPGDGLPTLSEAVAWVDETGGVPYLAHPYWSGLRADEFENCDGLVGLEVYNAGCELEVGRGLSGVHWDDALERGRRLHAIATDDSHHPGFDSSLAWTWARVGDRSQDGVLEALREGTFYSSTGPRIHGIAVSNGVVEVRSSSAQSVTLLTGRMRGASVNAGRLGYSYRGEILERSDGGGILAARLAAPRQAPYARVEVADANGGRAWTNPLWI
jgi:hypothetical protein